MIFLLPCEVNDYVDILVLTSVKVRGALWRHSKSWELPEKTRLTLSLFICHGKRCDSEHTWPTVVLKVYQQNTHDHVCIHTLCYRPPAFHCWTTNRHKPTSETTSDHLYYHHHRHLSGEHVTWSHNVLWMVVYEHNETVVMCVASWPSSLTGAELTPQGSYNLRQVSDCSGSSLTIWAWLTFYYMHLHRGEHVIKHSSNIYVEQQ